MNVTRYPVTLAIGAVLADLEAVAIVGYLPVPAGEEGDGGDAVGGSKPESASALLDGIDPTVPIETRETLRGLLRRFAATISTGETDLGRAKAVRHRIDTGTNRPFRQALRLHPTVIARRLTHR